MSLLRNCNVIGHRVIGLVQTTMVVIQVEASGVKCRHRLYDCSQSSRKSAHNQCKQNKFNGQRPCKDLGRSLSRFSVSSTTPVFTQGIEGNRAKTSFSSVSHQLHCNIAATDYRRRLTYGKAKCCFRIESLAKKPKGRHEVTAVSVAGFLSSFARENIFEFNETNRLLKFLAYDHSREAPKLRSMCCSASERRWVAQEHFPTNKESLDEGMSVCGHN